MKLVGGILGLSLWLALSAMPVAMAGGHGAAAGDEDPFPLMCADFSGNWKSDGGDRYSIQQRQCSYLRMQMSYGGESDTMTIVPDNRMRPDRGSQVRHRWNNPHNATVLESHRTYNTANGYRITEVTMFERANDGLLLETTYRTIECLSAPDQPPRHEYEQTVFRKVEGAWDKGVNDEVPLPRPRPKHAPKR